MRFNCVRFDFAVLKLNLTIIYFKFTDTLRGGEGIAMIRLNVIFVLILAVVGLTSCAHARLDSWEGDKYTVCCRHCNHQDWEELKAKYCEGNSTPVGGKENREVTGAYTSSTGSYQVSNGSVNGSSYGQTNLIKRTEKCHVYQCSGKIINDE